MLFLTFNDVLLNKANVFSMLMDNSISTRKMQKDLLDSNFFIFDTSEYYKEEINKCFDSKNICRNDWKPMISLFKNIYNFFEIAHPDPTIWFKDNAGEYLVNIHIERSIWKSDLSCPKKLAMSVMRKFEHCLRLDSGLRNHPKFWHSKVPIILGIILLYLLIDIIVSYMVSSRQRMSENSTPLEN